MGRRMSVLPPGHTHIYIYHVHGALVPMLRTLHAFRPGASRGSDLPGSFVKHCFPSTVMRPIWTNFHGHYPE